MGDLAAIIGDVSLFHHQLLKLVTRLVTRCNTKSAMFTINKCIYNHHPEDFARKDLEVIAFLMCAWGTKHAWLYSSIEWAWFLWYFKTEVPMLMCGIILFGLQSRRLILHGLLVLHLKRCIVERSSLRTTYSRPEEGGPNSIEDNDDRSSSQKWRVSSKLHSSEDFATSKRTGSDDTNGDVCIIFSNGFCSGSSFAKEFSKHGVAVAEAFSLSISPRLPWDARSFSSGQPRRRSKSRMS